MDDKNKKPDLIAMLQATLDDHLGKEEFTTAFAQVVETMKTYKAQSEAEFAAMQSAISALSQKLANDNSTDLAALKAEAQTALAAIHSAVSDQMAQVHTHASQLQNGPQGEKGDQGEPGNDGLPDTADDIRNKLELIVEEDEKLKIDAIGHLREELDRLEKKISRGSGSGAVIASQRGQVKVYDLSASLDGIKSTFSLPAFWRVLTVDLSSAPNALRPTVDFTTDANAVTITFTSQIDPATQLASGQTCIVTYAEA